MKNFILATALAAGMLTATTSGAAPAKSDVTVVLVHGAWADGSSWNKVIPLLQAKGIDVLVVQNPLTSLADDVAATQRTMASAKGKIVLVGHSWAGTVITEAGSDPRVTALVYVAAFANNDGQSAGELVNSYPKTPALATIRDDGHGFLYQTADGVRDNFAPDLPKSESQVMAVTQGALAASTFGDKVTKAAWKAKPTWYVVSADDRVINPQMERDSAKLMKAKTTVLASSHVSLLSHPKEVAAVIEDTVKTVSENP
ncbi:pimeloyl-ACP methyl ester carboxylesterase [Luteibacter rhizovicinus]|uniref:Pimeloyl-ACP methyl ester carboxylesterase n=1 Tax=Luteibacter rhizovicinus TaxID=242606 RepID=A0A4R3YMD7_9GAMM|nr:alpha/beta hydrolase [Luteibacter rhizovicinus]TCV93431.1 pimeloyl-ACP methyl ester carboxylesterase [Luteibacter rhizovicinus]